MIQSYAIIFEVGKPSIMVKNGLSKHIRLLDDFWGENAPHLLYLSTKDPGRAWPSGKRDSSSQSGT